MASVPPPPRLPIGISDFRKLREPGVIYVDKTDFVTQVLASRREVVLVPRPRRFGKTVNLSTVRHFVEKSSEDPSALFEGLSVWSSAEARAHFQRYPVISLTFKDVKAGSFDEAFEAIRGEIRRAFRDHRYLLDEGALRPEEAARFEQILRVEGPVSLYAESLRELSRHLALHHGERAFILIDEYDTPIHAAGTPEDERRMLDFICTFLSGGLKDNCHLFKGILMGQLPSAGARVSSALDNLSVYSLMRSEYAPHFGFTRADVEDVVQRKGCAEDILELSVWYNGYRFGNHLIYNPSSVIEHLANDDHRRHPDWGGASSHGLLHRAIFAHGLDESIDLETLMHGGRLRKAINERVALGDLDASSEAVWSLLLLTGYLKFEEVRREDLDIVADLSIPNKEVLCLYQEIFESKMALGLHVSRRVGVA